MFSKPNIIVATDFSPVSDLALLAGESLRRRSDGTVHVVHVSSFPSDWDWFIQDVAAHLPPHYKRDLENSLKERMMEQVRRCEARASVEVVFGKPFEGLQQLITERPCDLVVLGNRGQGESFLQLGSLSTKVVAAATVPVLVVKEPFACNKVAGLIDTLSPQDSIYSASQELAFLLGAELEMISLFKDISAQIERRSPVATDVRMTYTDEERAAILKRMREEISRQLDPRSKAQVRVAITDQKDTAAALVDLLEQERIDLGVMARHQQGFFEKLFIGSVTRAVIEGFRGNVLVLPPQKA